MFYDYYQGPGMAMGVFWLLFMLGLAVLVASLLVMLVRHAPAGPHSSTADTPEAILAERFARGEIDENEYRERIKVLGNRPR